MNLRIQLSLAVLATLLTVYGAQGRQCYGCSSEGDYDSADACKAEDPDKGKLNSYNVPDDNECYLCTKKIYDANDAVVRGCMTKDDWDDTYKDEFDDDDDKCIDSWTEGSTVEGTYCVCTGNKCNSGNSLIAPLAVILLAITTKMFL